MTFEQKHQKKEAIKIWSHIRNNQHRHEKEKRRKTKKWTKHNTKKIKSGLLRLFRKESGSLSISFADRVTHTSHDIANTVIFLMSNLRSILISGVVQSTVDVAISIVTSMTCSTCFIEIRTWLCFKCTRRTSD